MLKPQEMCHVTIAGPKSLLEKTINALYSSSVLHITDYSDVPGFERGEPLPQSQGISGTLVKLRSIASQLNVPQKRVSGRKSDEKVEKQALELERGILVLADRAKAADEGLARQRALAAELSILVPFGMDVSSYHGYKSISVFVGRVKDAKALERGLPDADVHYAAAGKEKFASIFVKTGTGVSKAFSDAGFAEAGMAGTRGLKGPPGKLLADTDAKIAALVHEKEMLKEEMQALGKKHSDYLLQNIKHLGEESEKAEAPLRFTQSRNAFVSTGWVPVAKYANLKAALEGACGDRIYISCSKPAHGENPPTALKNPKAVSPFEFFLDLYSLPKAREIDPSFFMFITFPLFFGAMLGDFGYGSLLLALFFVARMKMPGLRPLLNVMIYSSILTIVFGLAYGEFFGLEEIGDYKLPALLNRVHDTTAFLLMALAFGVVQVNLGLVLGFINKLEHGFKAALFEKGAWLILEAGAVLAIFVSPYLGGALALVAVSMLVKAEGIRGILELPTIVTNILSYARIMAVGLVSVILALVVNEMSGDFFQGGGIGLVLGIGVLLVGHAINLVLGFVSPFIHSMRLHYVEFFMKFYEGGGQRYTPFGKR